MTLSTRLNLSASSSYNPEFIAQGDIINGQLKPDMVRLVWNWREHAIS